MAEMEVNGPSGWAAPAGDANPSPDKHNRNGFSEQAAANLAGVVQEHKPPAPKSSTSVTPDSSTNAPPKTEPEKRGPGRPAGSGRSTHPEAIRARHRRAQGKDGHQKRSTPATARPTAEELEAQRAQDEQEVAALFFGLLAPVNPQPGSSLREFHYSDPELHAICGAGAKVWLKYFPAGAGNIPEEMVLALAIASTTGPKFAAYRSRRRAEGNPIKWPRLWWEKIRNLFRRRKAAAE
jgi:hypothetical protein